MLKNLSPTNGFHLRAGLLNLGGAAALVLTLAITASAYTLVLRNGQRIEIPSEFTLTRTTLTYEISPGFNKTMQLILIDVAATERANREAPGSFFKHREPSPVDPPPAPPQASRTLTNIDLAAVRQRRIESEQAYEKRRAELGLPTVEETRRRQAVEGAALHEQIREGNMAKAREESYWRARARALRTEIATVDTQINYVRSRLGEINDSSLNNRSWTNVYPIWPNNGPYYPYPPLGLPPVGRPVPGMGYPYPYPYPNGSVDDFDNYTRAELTKRLDDLQLKRASLAVQWKLLEDDARDARIPQVWLEP